MDARQMKYNMAEISEATGIDPKELTARKAALMKAGTIEARKGYQEFTYDEVMKIIQKPRKKGEPRPEHIQALKRQLLTDGFNIKK